MQLHTSIESKIRSYTTEFRTKSPEMSPLFFADNASLLKKEDNIISEGERPMLLRKIRRNSGGICECKRVMVIDDQEFIIQTFKKMIQFYPIDFVFASSGLEALEKMESLVRGKCSDKCKIVNVIFVDYQMPGMNGIETAKKLREMFLKQRIAQIKLILSTGMSQSEIAIDDRKIFDGILLKPVSYDTLRGKIKEFCDL
jgi:CheY-like chemotaxis protein